MTVGAAKGTTAPDKRMDLTDILLVSLQELANAGRAERACRLAGRACAALRQCDPTAWKRFNVLLHQLSRQVT